MDTRGNKTQMVVFNLFGLLAHGTVQAIKWSLDHDKISYDILCIRCSDKSYTGKKWEIPESDVIAIIKGDEIDKLESEFFVGYKGEELWTNDLVIVITDKGYSKETVKDGNVNGNVVCYGHMYDDGYEPWRVIFYSKVTRKKGRSDYSVKTPVGFKGDVVSFYNPLTDERCAGVLLEDLNDFTGTVEIWHRGSDFLCFMPYMNGHHIIDNNKLRYNSIRIPSKFINTVHTDDNSPIPVKGTKSWTGVSRGMAFIERETERILECQNGILGQMCVDFQPLYHYAK